MADTNWQRVVGQHQVHELAPGPVLPGGPAGRVLFQQPVAQDFRAGSRPLKRGCGDLASFCRLARACAAARNGSPCDRALNRFHPRAFRVKVVTSHEGNVRAIPLNSLKIVFQLFMSTRSRAAVAPNSVELEAPHKRRRLGIAVQAQTTELFVPISDFKDARYYPIVDRLFVPARDMVLKGRRLARRWGDVRQSRPAGLTLFLEQARSEPPDQDAFDNCAPIPLPDWGVLGYTSVA